MLEKQKFPEDYEEQDDWIARHVTLGARAVSIKVQFKRVAPPKAPTADKL